MVLDKEKRVIGICTTILVMLVVLLATVPKSDLALSPKYFPIHRKIRDITDFMWPVELTSNSELKINVSTTDGWLEIGYVIPEGFTSELYFKNASTGKLYFAENISGSGGYSGALHYYIKDKGGCVIGLDGIGIVRIMAFFHFYKVYEGDVISSDVNITNLDLEVYSGPSNPAYFKFKTPKDVCVYGFAIDSPDSTTPLALTGMDESNSTTKTVIIHDDDVSNIDFAFFVFYNRTGGPVHDVKLIDYGAYSGGKSLPAIYGLIPLSLVLIAVGVTWYWIKKK
jgi:hypothetical protein